jgi:hypothetical protein
LSDAGGLGEVGCAIDVINEMERMNLYIVGILSLVNIAGEYRW